MAFHSPLDILSSKLLNNSAWNVYTYTARCWHCFPAFYKSQHILIFIYLLLRRTWYPWDLGSCTAIRIPQNLALDGRLIGFSTSREGLMHVCFFFIFPAATLGFCRPNRKQLAEESSSQPFVYFRPPNNLIMDFEKQLTRAQTEKKS